MSVTIGYGNGHVYIGCFQLGMVGQGSTTDVSQDTSEALESRRVQAQERYDAVVGGEGERLVSGSDDFTLFMWQPQLHKTPMTRMVVSKGLEVEWGARGSRVVHIHTTSRLSVSCIVGVYAMLSFVICTFLCAIIAIVS